ncbi:unnamed protein product [Staurois parvus]|uniref:Uncharacterized protein n=1 Tax=Staurois parvus TaxID=386267 RepID=A0ABN9C6X6_9NEOB|nr:unnamed protein product [Staurois parvus]
MTVMGMYRRGVRRYDSDGYVQEREEYGGMTVMVCTGEEYGGMTVMGMYRRGVRRYDSDGYVHEECGEYDSDGYVQERSTEV